MTIFGNKIDLLIVAVFAFGGFIVNVIFMPTHTSQAKKWDHELPINKLSHQKHPSKKSVHPSFIVRSSFVHPIFKFQSKNGQQVSVFNKINKTNCDLWELVYSPVFKSCTVGRVTGRVTSCPSQGRYFIIIWYRSALFNCILNANLIVSLVYIE